MALSTLNHDVWEEVKEICSEHHKLLKEHHDPVACGTAGQHRLESTGAGFLSSLLVLLSCCQKKSLSSNRKDLWLFGMIHLRVLKQGTPSQFSVSIPS